MLRCEKLEANDEQPARTGLWSGDPPLRFSTSGTTPLLPRAASMSTLWSSMLERALPVELAEPSVLVLV
jgi:hypothetical protein